MFCQWNTCNISSTCLCHEEHTTYNLLPQYHTQNQIIQNPNLVRQIQINYEKLTSIPKHMYTNLKTYPIHQILDTIETTRKDKYHSKKVLKKSL